MDEKSLTREEIEELSYYDFMGYVKAPFFNIGGIGSIDRLAELCQINEKSRILVVGCGTGWNACYLARTFGCQVVGIDVAAGKHVYRFPDQPDGSFQIAFLGSDHAHQVQCVRIFGINPEDGPVSGFGLCQVSCLVTSDRLI